MSTMPLSGSKAMASNCLPDHDTVSGQNRPRREIEYNLQGDIYLWNQHRSSLNSELRAKAEGEKASHKLVTFSPPWLNSKRSSNVEKTLCGPDLDNALPDLLNFFLRGKVLYPRHIGEKTEGRNVKAACIRSTPRQSHAQAWLEGSPFRACLYPLSPEPPTVVLFGL